MIRGLPGQALALTIAVALLGGGSSWSGPAVDRETGAAEAAPLRDDGDVEFYFELKLMLRDRMMLRRVAVDQWVRGRLWMRSRTGDGGSRTFSLVQPLEDPWVFRWYPTKHEVKLGAAISVPSPAGDPYDALETELGDQARQRYREWWSNDRVKATLVKQPSWQHRADRFWAEQHTAEESEKDPLHPFPVYPFHVLGDPAERFAFNVRANGSVDSGSVANRMSEPWLATGWSEWLAGRPQEGYGYWDRERPEWEPRTYEALTEAVKLLDWSPLRPPGSTGEDNEYSLEFNDAGERLAVLVRTLNPKFSKRINWRGTAVVRFVEQRDGTGALGMTGSSDDRPLTAGKSAVVFRIWRHTLAFGESSTGIAAKEDELQVFAGDGELGTMKLWLRIGYRPLAVENRR